MRSPALSVAVTVVGHAAGPEGFVTRSGARPGDALLVSGELGGAAAGLIALERREEIASIPAATATGCCAASSSPSRGLPPAAPWPRRGRRR